MNDSTSDYIDLMRGCLLFADSVTSSAIIIRVLADALSEGL